MLARQIIFSRPLPIKLTPFLPYSCSLFVTPKKVNSFGIKQIQPLFAKHPGCGGTHARLAFRISHPHPLLCADSALSASLRYPLPAFAPSRHSSLATFRPLCFHNLTNCFSRNPFPFTTIRIAGGVPPKPPNVPTRSRCSIVMYVCSTFNFQLSTVNRPSCPLECL